MKIPCVTSEQLIAANGKPFFIKVDVEGADFQVIQSLSSTTAPSYISLELSLTDPIVEKLIGLGYSSFKFVNGQTYRPTTPIFDHQVGWRILRKAGRVAPIIRNLISKMPETIRAKSEFDPPGKYSPDGYIPHTIAQDLSGKMQQDNGKTRKRLLPGSIG